jgi:hypothetical protein
MSYDQSSTDTLVRSHCEYRLMLRELIWEGFTKLRWGWIQSIAPALQQHLCADPPLATPVTLALVRSIIADAETSGSWAPGWAEQQLAAAREQQRNPAPLSPNATLNSEAVRSIRKRYRAQYRRRITIKQLAREYGVSIMTIRRVLSRTTWSHI